MFAKNYQALSRKTAPHVVVVVRICCKRQHDPLGYPMLLVLLGVSAQSFEKLVFRLRSFVELCSGCVDNGRNVAVHTLVTAALVGVASQFRVFASLTFGCVDDIAPLDRIAVSIQHKISSFRFCMTL